MSLFQEAEWGQIIERLLKATDAGTLTWEEGESWGAGPTYTSRTDVGINYVLKSRDGDGRFPYTLDLYKSDATALDSYQARPYDPEYLETYEERNSSNLDQLYTAAKRQTTGAAAAFDSIISSLDNLIPPVDEQPF